MDSSWRKILIAILIVTIVSNIITGILSWCFNQQRISQRYKTVTLICSVRLQECVDKYPETNEGFDVSIEWVK